MREGKKVVMVVDDEALFRTMLKEVITSGGYSFYEAGRGKEAFGLIPEVTPDVVIVDHHLPDTKGLNVIKRIKCLLPRVKIIFMSGESCKDIFKKALDAGADAIFAKPFDVFSLLEKIGEMI